MVGTAAISLGTDVMTDLASVLNGLKMYEAVGKLLLSLTFFIARF